MSAADGGRVPLNCNRRERLNSATNELLTEALAHIESSSTSYGVDKKRSHRSTSCKSCSESKEQIGCSTCQSALAAHKVSGAATLLAINFSKAPQAHAPHAAGQALMHKHATALTKTSSFASEPERTPLGRVTVADKAVVGGGFIENRTPDAAPLPRAMTANIAAQPKSQAGKQPAAASLTANCMLSPPQQLRARTNLSVDDVLLIFQYKDGLHRSLHSKHSKVLARRHPRHLELAHVDKGDSTKLITRV